jgi:hypothetical protein
VEVLLETAFSTVVRAEGLYGGQLGQEFGSWKGAAIQRSLEPRSNGISIVRRSKFSWGFFEEFTDC